MSIDTPNPAEMRIMYDKDQLNESDLASTPLEQFRKWLADALAIGATTLIEPNAMVLAVRSNDDVISTRSVLLKGIDNRGLTFYTNYGSTKANAIATNSGVSVTFPWYPLHRQVNIIGTAAKVSREESAIYFDTRPHSSKLGAIVSAQSAPIESREVLEARMAQLEAQYPEGSQVPLPDAWGGYLITVESIEFWQGRRSRLHDRLRFVRRADSSDLSDASAWKVIRLSP